MTIFVVLMPTYITILFVLKKKSFICKQPAKHNMLTDSQQTSDCVWKMYSGKSDRYVFIH